MISILHQHLIPSLLPLPQVSSYTHKNLKLIPYLTSLTLCGYESTDQCVVVGDFRADSSPTLHWDTWSCPPPWSKCYPTGLFWTALGSFLLQPFGWWNQPVPTAETSFQAQSKVVSTNTWRDEGIYWCQYLAGHWHKARNPQLLVNGRIPGKRGNTACVSTRSFWTSNQVIQTTAAIQLGCIITCIWHITTEWVHASYYKTLFVFL